MSTPRWQNPQTAALFRAFLSLRTLAEAQRFCRDLLTVGELEEFSARWQAARMLDRGRPYTEIVEATGLSSRTIARVQRWLRRGQGGYRLMIKLQHHRSGSVRKRSVFDVR